MARSPTLILLAALALALGGFVGVAGGHQSGCHAAHTCPSDHHTYIWYDSAGQGWDCAAPGADEYDPSRDTTAIAYQGLTWYCRPAGGPPTPTPTPPTPDRDGDGVPDSGDACPDTPAPGSANGCPTPPPSSGRVCGVERWEVKTLQDDRAHLVDFTPLDTTVNALRRKRAPDIDDDTPRIAAVETTTYRVRAQLVGFKKERDSDIHLVIGSPRDRRRTMIVEFPTASCAPLASATARAKMTRARRALTDACGSPTRSYRRLRGTATITGVGFWDEIHGQTGVAPNGIELHPVIAFRASRCVHAT